MENEKWVELYEFPNYEISNTGKVRNIKRNKLLKVELDSDGYNNLCLYKDGKKYRRRVGRLVWMSFNNQFCKHTIDHINSDSSDDRIKNLQCIPIEDNRGRRKNYEKKNKYNLTNEIRAYIHTSMTDKTETSWTIMKKYGLPLRYIRKVMERGSWKKYVKDGI